MLFVNFTINPYFQYFLIYITMESNDPHLIVFMNYCANVITNVTVNSLVGNELDLSHTISANNWFSSTVIKGNDLKNFSEKVREFITRPDALSHRNYTLSDNTDIEILKTIYAYLTALNLVDIREYVR
jgi:hypothetical protein